MEPCSTALERVSVANIHHSSTGPGMLQYLELKRQGTTRIYQTHLDAWTTNNPDFPVNRRAPHHVLWTDQHMETPEGFEPDDTGTRGYSKNRCPKFTIHAS